MINCQYWSSCKVVGGGCCALNLFGGKPSLGTCRRCQKRVPLTADGVEIEIEPEPKSLVEKAASYIKAEVSNVVSSIPEEAVELRLAECRQCPSLKPSTNPSELGWCSACGCGQSPRAELTVKAKMPAATCPKNKWPS